MQISEIVRNYGKHLKGFIRKRVRSTEDAEDILQDVFYKLAESDYLMKPIEQVSAWLYTLARNRIVDLYRKKKPEQMPEYFYDNLEEELLSELSELLDETEASPEHQNLEALIWSELQKGLEELPREQSLVFELHELKGISFKGIARLTGEPVNTLISRKRYAVLYLRERLRPLYNELINN